MPRYWIEHGAKVGAGVAASLLAGWGFDHLANMAATPYIASCARGVADIIRIGGTGVSLAYGAYRIPYVMDREQRLRIRGNRRTASEIRSETDVMRAENEFDDTV